MGEFFECELRLNSGENKIKIVHLRVIPHIGEHISTVLDHDGKLHQFLIKEIWHWATEISSDHKIILYVTHA